MARPATGQVVIRDGTHGRRFELHFRVDGRQYRLMLDGIRSEREAEGELRKVLADVDGTLAKFSPPARPEGF